jgi:hypothetical protein
MSDMGGWGFGKWRAYLGYNGMATLPTNKISDGRRGCNVYGITT